MKTKLAIFGSMAAIIAVGSILAAQAQTAALVASCSGSVSGNAITWSASATHGNAPYSFVWSGDSSLAGQTSTAITHSYTTNGTYVANVQATDASSSVATSTCSATVTANVPPATTSTLNVVLSVNNAAGGTAIPANFTVTVSGAGATPSAFSGVSAGKAVVVNGGTAYSIGVSSLANYSMSKSGNCSGPIAAGAADACTVTEAFVPPTVTTSTLPHVNPPMLSITPSGNFLGRGMVVTSVASGSFQAQVWGVTYTVNWTGSLFPEFIFRGGDDATSTTNPTQQIAVGDEVGVSGRVSVDSPLVVTAKVVRDYSILKARKPFFFGHRDGDDKDKGKGDDKDDNASNTSTNGFTQRINDLFNQFHNLQNLFQGNGNGGNKGNDNGNGDH